MSTTVILVPVLMQVLLTLLLFIRLGVEKSKASAAGGVDRHKAALHYDAWPDAVLKVSNNIRNQFETPILFYVLAIVFCLLNEVDLIVLGLAVVYVASRYIHAWVHTSSNYVPWRLRSFMLGAVVLLILLFIAMTRLLVSLS